MYAFRYMNQGWLGGGGGGCQSYTNGGGRRKHTLHSALLHHLSEPFRDGQVYLCHIYSYHAIGQLAVYLGFFVYMQQKETLIQMRREGEENYCVSVLPRYTSTFGAYQLNNMLFECIYTYEYSMKMTCLDVIQKRPLHRNVQSLEPKFIDSGFAPVVLLSDFPPLVEHVTVVLCQKPHMNHERKSGSSIDELLTQGVQS